MGLAPTEADQRLRGLKRAVCTCSQQCRPPMLMVGKGLAAHLISGPSGPASVVAWRIRGLGPMLGINHLLSWTVRKAVHVGKAPGRMGHSRFCRLQLEIVH